MTLQSWAASPASMSGALTVLNGYDMSLAFLHDWRLLLVDELPEHMLGYTDFEAGRIVILESLPYSQMRSTAAHECVHAVRGSWADRGVDREDEEQEVESIASAFLIPDQPLARSLGVEKAANWWAVDATMAAFRVST